MKQAFALLILGTLAGCATRTFNVNSDPTNAKVYYQTRQDKVFKGYTPIKISDDPDNLSASSKVYIEKDGFDTSVVNIGGFQGTQVSLYIKLEKDNTPKDYLVDASGETILTPTNQSKASDYKEDLNFPKDKEIEKKEPAATPAVDLNAEMAPPIPVPAAALLTAPPATTPPLPAPTPTLPTELPPSTPADEELMNDLLVDESDMQNKNFQKLMQKLEKMEQELSGLKNRTEDSEGTAVKMRNTALEHLFTAQRLVQANRLNEALVETYKAVAIDNKLAFAFAIQGSIYFLKRDYNSALDSWKRSLELDPSNMEVLTIYNRVKQRTGRTY
jgi:tetratricopeptide (TPR) repeat protein